MQRPPTFTVFTAIVVATLTVYVASDLSDLSESEKFCLKDINSTESEIMAFINSTMNKPTDVKENIKCFLKCVLEREGHMKNGTYLEENAVKAMRATPSMKDVPNLEKIVAGCKSEKGTTDCDTGFKIMMCYAKNNVTIH